MTKLGPNLWDDPTFVLGTILPKSDGTFDLGSASNRFRNIYLTGDINLDDITIQDELIFTGTPGLIKSSHTNSQINIAGGVGATAADGAYIEVKGIGASGGPDINLHTGNANNGDVNVYLENAASFFVIRNSAGTDVLDISATGNIRYSQGTFGIFSATTGLTLRLAGGASLSSALGAYSYLQSVGAGGEANLTGGNVATGNVTKQITHASAVIQNLNSSGVVMWSTNNSGDMTSGATGGGNLIFAAATKGIQLQSGANGRTGTFTLNGATPVVVNNTSLAAGDQIIISRDTIGGTPGAFNLTARTNGASFTVTGTAADTSGMRYTLVRIN